MKNYKIKALFLGSVLTIIIVLISCNKQLDLTDPNNLTPESYFKTSAQILAGTNATYSSLKGFGLVAREWFYVHDTRGDEFATGGGQLEVPRFQLLTGNSDPTNTVMASVWNALYVTINRANTVIANSANGADNKALTARAVGEASFLRAWAYYNLVTLWGAVPLVVAPTASLGDFKPRSKTADVYAVIIKDLQNAAAVLPGKSGYAAVDNGRATAAAANALLGRVSMQIGDYAGAKAYFLKIPTSGADGYQLTDRYLDNFEEETELNKESIFEVLFFDKNDGGFNWNSDVGDGSTADLTTTRNQEYNAVAWRNMIPSDKYLANFESTANGAAKADPRFSYSVYRTGDLINNNTEKLTDAEQNGNSSVLNGVTQKISWRKTMLTYKENVSMHLGGNNQRIIRYAEILADLAECEIELGNLANATGYLNQLRNRASVAMPNYPTTQYTMDTKANAFKTLMHEKLAELGGEELRNIDILRWRAKGYFTQDPLSYFKANRDELLPIPQAEIDNNPQLGSGGVNKQNPGY